MYKEITTTKQEATNTKKRTSTNTKKEYGIQDFLNFINATFNRLDAMDSALHPDDYEIEYESFNEHRERVSKLLPKFTPMKCMNCSKRTQCNNSREYGVCNEYTVTID